MGVEKLCPPGMTARNFGGMYSIEFVQRCLEARNLNAGKEVTVEVVKNIGGDVIAELTYAILVAKTKSRREIMKSRKVVNVEETYGTCLQVHFMGFYVFAFDGPAETIPVC